MTKLYNPYDKYASSENISLGDFIVEDWNCELVPANHPALKKRANINPFGSNIDWHEREQQMFKLMRDRIGIGLAAPQIGSSYRMFVMLHSHLGNIGIYNPEILETEGNVVVDEGCLTFPLMFMKIKRPARIRVRFTKTCGTKDVEMWMDGTDARCFLHEYDHLEGKLFIDDASDLKIRRALEQQKKRVRQLQKQLGA